MLGTQCWVDLQKCRSLFFSLFSEPNVPHEPGGGRGALHHAQHMKLYIGRGEIAGASGAGGGCIH